MNIPWNQTKWHKTSFERNQKKFRRPSVLWFVIHHNHSQCNWWTIVRHQIHLTLSPLVPPPPLWKWLLLINTRMFWFETWALHLRNQVSSANVVCHDDEKYQFCKFFNPEKWYNFWDISTEFCMWSLNMTMIYRNMRSEIIPYLISRRGGGIWLPPLEPENLLQSPYFGWK